jgi:hypothetical protein
LTIRRLGHAMMQLHDSLDARPAAPPPSAFADLLGYILSICAQLFQFGDPDRRRIDFSLRLFLGRL